MDERADGYIGMTGRPIPIGGHLFHLRIHWANIGGAAKCVGVDLRSFTSDQERALSLDDAQPVEPLLLSMVGVETGWAEIDTAVYRALRLASEIEVSRSTSQGLAQWVRTGKPKAAAFWAGPAGADASDHERTMTQRDKPKRGAPTRYTQQVLEDVVEPAWATGHPGRIEAVRSALEVHFRERVTADQAKKAISAARNTNPPLIPPATRGKGTS